MSSNKLPAAGKLRDRYKNLTDTSLLLIITIVVFFLMYIANMYFQCIAGVIME